MTVKSLARSPMRVIVKVSPDKLARTRTVRSLMGILNLFATISDEVDLRSASRSDRHRSSTTIDRNHLQADPSDAAASHKLAGALLVTGFCVASSTAVRTSSPRLALRRKVPVQISPEPP